MKIHSVLSKWLNEWIFPDILWQATNIAFKIYPSFQIKFCAAAYRLKISQAFCLSFLLCKAFRCTMPKTALPVLKNLSVLQLLGCLNASPFLRSLLQLRQFTQFTLLGNFAFLFTTFRKITKIYWNKFKSERIYAKNRPLQAILAQILNGDSS